MRTKIGFMAILLVLFLPGFLFASSSGDINKKRDGTSPAKAYVLYFKRDYLVSLDQEEVFLRKKYGFKNADWKLLSQDTLKKDDYIYDVVSVQVMETEKVEKVYFDITDIFKR